jgi:drug/metabolite transporter (DMT)-like permease
MGMVGRDRVRPRVVTLAGLLLGFVGIGVLVWPSAGAGALNVMGLAALALAAFFWALGSIRSRHARVPASPLLAVAMQMIVGGGVWCLSQAWSGSGPGWTRPGYPPVPRSAWAIWC